MTFNNESKRNGPKLNLIARLEFDLAYYDVSVYHVSHLGMGTPLQKGVQERRSTNSKYN